MIEVSFDARDLEKLSNGVILGGCLLVVSKDHPLLPNELKNPIGEQK